MSITDEAQLDAMMAVPDDQLDEYMANLDSGSEELTDEPETDEDDTQDESTDLDEADDEELDDETEEDDSEDESDSEDGLEEDEDTDEEPATTSTSKIFKPFKANGKEIQVKNEDDAIRLMQLGANYNLKMAGMKPHLKTIRMLEENDLLEDQDKLNLLIAVSKGDKEAIMKLVADNEIDPLDIDTDEAKGYKNTQDYSISDAQYEFETTVNELAPLESFKLVSSTTAGWDSESKAQIYQNPAILKGLNSMAENPEFFSQVQEQISTLRALGQVPTGLNDIDVFASVAQQLEQESGAQQKPTTATKAAKRDIPANAEVIRRKKAAVPSRGSRTTSRAQVINPLALSDEEFEKAAADGVFDELFK